MNLAKGAVYVVVGTAALEVVAVGIVFLGALALLQANRNSWP